MYILKPITAGIKPPPPFFYRPPPPEGCFQGRGGHNHTTVVSGKMWCTSESEQCGLHRCAQLFFTDGNRNFEMLSSPPSGSSDLW